jgi:hypothetical protein
MASDLELLRACLASFEAATRSLESVRILLSEVIDVVLPPEPDDLADFDDSVRPCSHVDALEVTTLGDGAPTWLCPDCGEQFS